MNETKTPPAAGETEIDLRKLLMAYLHHWWIFVICVVPLACLALLYTVKFVTPVYTASVTIYVNNIRSDQDIEYISNTNLTTAQMLVDTYARIVTSRTVLNAVIEREKLDCDYAELVRRISTSQVGETAIFRVAVTHPDPEKAAEYANAIARSGPSEIESFVEGSSAKVLDAAEVPTSISSPSYRRSFALGGAAGLLLALVIVTVMFFMDVKIRNADDLAAISALPVVGQIPDFVTQQRGEKSGSRKGDAK